MTIAADEALVAVGRGATLVTVNKRLARSFRHAYQQQRRSEGREAWNTPDILPWSAWVDRIWELHLYDSRDGSEIPTRLTPVQEQLVWEQVIDSESNPGLLSLGATAQSAREAWGLLYEWELSRSEVEAYAGDDCLAFLGWASRFERLCDERGWIDGTRSATCLIPRLTLRILPQTALLAGFSELSPHQASFLEAGRQAGCEFLQVSDPEIHPSRVVRVQAHDPEAEIELAARWARRFLEQDGSAQVGVIIPDLQSCRPQVERIFHEILQPAADDWERIGPRRTFNISAGKRLSDYPVIRAALMVLQLEDGPNELSLIGRLLRSRFIAGGEGELGARARIDVQLRRLGGVSVPMEAVLDHCRTSHQDCPQLDQALKRWKEVRTKLPSRQRPSRWAGSFSRLLRTIGWPGDAPLSSNEHQAIKAWRELLSDFARLDAVGAEMSYPDAFFRLKRLTSEKDFQPRTQPAPIEILGILESTGAKWDGLWIAGANDESWPPPARPNPFLPIALQRRRDMPHASAQRELAFARRETQRLLAAAGEIVISHAGLRQDRELSPSSLFTQIPATEQSALEVDSQPTYAAVLRESSCLESTDDVSGPPLESGDVQPGGTSLFRFQALCPFRAFAQIRLAANSLEQPAPGLGPKERGVLVHETLELVWRRLGTHSQLLSQSNESLSELVEECAADAIKGLEKRRSVEIEESFGTLEARRLTGLICAWLEVEKERPPFAVVSPEGRREIELGGVRTRVRIDRVDRLEDGREVIIDYKTGQPSIKSWEGPRPSEPQVPLYAVSHRGDLGAALFAQIKAGKSAFIGWSSEPAAVPQAKTADLKAMTEGWRETLEVLGEDFTRGRAEVDPQSKACSTCSLHSLCRVHEMRWQDFEEDD